MVFVQFVGQYILLMELEFLLIRLFRLIIEYIFELIKMIMSQCVKNDNKQPERLKPIYSKP